MSYVIYFVNAVEYTYFFISLGKNMHVSFFTLLVIGVK